MDDLHAELLVCLARFLSNSSKATILKSSRKIYAVLKDRIKFTDQINLGLIQQTIFLNQCTNILIAEVFGTPKKILPRNIRNVEFCHSTSEYIYGKYPELNGVKCVKFNWFVNPIHMYMDYPYTHKATHLSICCPAKYVLNFHSGVTEIKIISYESNIYVLKKTNESPSHFQSTKRLIKYTIHAGIVSRNGNVYTSKCIIPFEEINQSHSLEIDYYYYD